MANKLNGNTTEEQVSETIKKSIDQSETKSVPDEVMNAMFGPAWRQSLEYLRKYPVESPATRAYLSTTDPQAENQRRQQSINEIFAMCEDMAKSS